MRAFPPDELERRVDEVLFYVWDPIGVAPEPAARYEYRSYVRKILEIVETGGEPDKIVKYLCDIESGMMSLPAREKQAQEAAELIYSHKEAIVEGYA